MFVLACRKTEQQLGWPAFAERRWTAGGLHLLFASDSGSGRYQDAPGGFSYVESPAALDPSDGTPPYTTIRYDGRGSGVLEVSAGPSSGSTVYYHLDGAGGFHCASHVRLLGALGIALEENTELLPDYFLYRYVTPPHTLYRGIQQLAKADLEVSFSGDRCVIRSVRPYPVFPAGESAATDEAGIVEGALRILDASLERLRKSRERLCVPLSGGMDSSVLFRLAQKKFGLNECYSAGYPFEADSDNVEKQYAVSAAAALGARHRYYAATHNEYLEAVVRSIAAAEEPIHHLQSAMFYLLFRDAVPQERDRVILGVGAGGVFGTPLQQLVHAYRTRQAAYDALARRPVKQAVEIASRLTGRGRRLVKAIDLSGRLELPMEDERNVVWSVDAYGSPEWIRERFRCSAASLVRSRTDLLRPHEERGLLAQIAVIDLFDKTQFIWAKLLQSQGRVAYYPFMQQDLHHHLLASPWPLRLQSNKHILAEVARRLEVPEFILRRAKSGFGVRRKDWALRNGPLEPLVPLATKVVGEEALRSMQSAQPQRAMTFWCLLNYGLWKRLCIDREPADALVAELRERLD